MINIVQLDGYAANPGDISISLESQLRAELGADCNVTTYPRTAPEEVTERAKDADIIIINKVQMSREVLEQLPRLRYIGVVATGYNVVDMQAAAERGITVTNVPAYSSDSVAQMVFAHLLHITNNVAVHADAVANGEWGRAHDFSFTLSPQQELAQQTMGIIGYGGIGKAVARIATAMGMRVLIAPSSTGRRRGSLPEGISEADSTDEVFAKADVLTLHCPLTPDTHHMVNDRKLSLMKPTAIVINTGRGPLIDEQALADALTEGRIYAAGIDVLTEEPPVNGSPLIGAPRCYITPHIAWATVAARTRLLGVVAANIKAFLNGAPQNVVR